MMHTYIRWLGSVAVFCHRRALPMFMAAMLLSAGCIAYAWTHMAISTDANALLSDKLSFTHTQAKFAHAFPDSGDAIVIILDGDTTDIVEQGAHRLSLWLATHHDAVLHVFSPGENIFFRKNGFLYLDVKGLSAVAGQLTEMQPVLARLARNPSLPGLVSLLQEALQHDTDGSNKAPEQLARMLDAIGGAVKATEQQHFFIFPWHEIMTGASTMSQRRRMIEVTPHMNEDEIQPAEQAIALVKQGIRELQLDKEHGMRVRLTGEAVLDYEQLQGAMRAAGLATGLAGALILLLLFLALKNARLVLAVTLTLVMSLVWTSAFALFATAPLNLISISFAVLFIGMGVDFGIQFCMRSLHESTDDIKPDVIILRTTKGLGMALGLSALAAAASFLSFTPTAYKGLADLGIIAGAGMFIALAATFTVLPALMGMMRLPISVSTGDASPLPHSSLSTQAAPQQPGALPEWIAVHAKRIISIAFALMLVSLVPTLNLHFDFNPLHLLDANNPAFKAFKSLASESKASPYAINIMRPNLAEADRFAAELDKQSTVSSVLTLSSLIPDQQQEKLSILDDLLLVMPQFTLQTGHVAVPAPAQIAAALVQLQQALKIYVQHAGNSPLASHAATLAGQLTDFLNHNGANNTALKTFDSNITGGLTHRIQMLSTALSAQNITINALPPTLKNRFLSSHGQARIQVFSKLDLDTPGNMSRFVRQIQMLAPDAVGDPVMMVEGGAVVARSFLQASLLAFGFVALLLVVSLGSLRDCMGVLLPLFLAALLTSTLMNVSGISLALGQRQAGLNGLFQSATPRAVLFSALTTLCSFGSMAISGDTAMMMLGKTLTIALICVLFCVLIVQPALFSLWTRNDRGNRRGINCGNSRRYD